MDKETYHALIDEALGLTELDKKKKTLRNKIGLPIGAGIFVSSEPVKYANSDMNDMLEFAKTVQNIIRRRGDNEEVYDIEEDFNGYRTYIKDSAGIIKQANFGYISDQHKSKKKKRTKPLIKKDTHYWTSSYWDDASIGDIIAEIVNPKQVDVSNLQQHQQLNPNFWEGETLKKEIRLILLKNALAFLKSLGVDDLYIEDIVFTGSLANYNYTDESDVDIHVIIDFNDIKGDEDFIKEFFLAKKAEWNNIGITIFGHDVETVAEDSNENNTWSAAYSIYYDKWIQKPIKNIVELNKHSIQLKASEIMNVIDKIESETDPEKAIENIDNIKTKLRKMRSSGLKKEGEYSIENLTYKVLRHTGYIDKLKELKNKFTVDDLSLDENNNN